MINVLIDSSGSMSSLGKPEVIQSIIREMQLTEGIDCSFFVWGEKVNALPLSGENEKIIFDGKSIISVLLDFMRTNEGPFLLLTDGFSNEDKSDLTSFIRDNTGIKFRVILVGADSREINGKTFFPENLMATEQKKYLFSSLEVSAAIESLNF